MIRNLLTTAAVLALAAAPALARPEPRGRAGGGGFNRPNNGGGINRPNNGGGHNRPGNGGRPGGNYNGGSGHNNVVINNNGGGHRGGYYGGNYRNDRDIWDAVGTAAAVTATVGLTRAIIGSTVNQQPTGCVPVNVGPTAYLQCGPNWYQPTYVGTQIQYVVVGAPR